VFSRICLCLSSLCPRPYALCSKPHAPGSTLQADHPVIYQKVSTTNPSGGSSYGQILKSSSIVGGAQAINYVIGLLRVKIVALLLGPAGVGLVGLYMSVVGAVQTFAQLGISESGVRQVAAASGKNDEVQLSQVATALRRICWLTGVLGWLLAVAFAAPLSRWIFDSDTHAWALAILGGAVLLEVVAGGQKALLQGVRRIGDLARVGVSSALLSTIVACTVYYFSGEKGIVPVLILVSAIQVGSSWFFSSRIELVPVEQPFRETVVLAWHMMKLGAPFMYGAVLGAGAGLVIRALVARDLGLDAAGIYQAAWALSGMFGGFILQALGTDFFPRLTAVSDDNLAANRLINEQVEVGVLLALPPLLFAVASAPLLVWGFYSSKFLEASNMMPWFVLGVFFQIVGWPAGTIMPAKSAAGWMFLAKTHSFVWQIGAAAVLLYYAGLVGIAGAFAVYTFAQLFLSQLIARRLCHFAFTPGCKRLVTKGCIVMAVALMVFELLPSNVSVPILLLQCALASFVCLRALSHRLGGDHPISRAARRFNLPGSWPDAVNGQMKSKRNP
jgi:enterobacterial common antigen flippase